MTMMTSGWVVKTHHFFDDKRWLIKNSAFSKPEKKLCFFVLFLSGSKWKKTFPFCFKKKKLLSLLVRSFFWFRPKWKKQQLSLFVCSFCFRPKSKKQNSLLVGFSKRRKKKTTATFFICLFFFLLPLMMTIDDRWVGGMEFLI